MKKTVPIVIVSTLTSSRLQYVCEWIFVERLGAEFRIVTPDEAKSFQGIFISYGVSGIDARLDIEPSGWLEEGYMSEEEPRLRLYEDIPIPVWGKYHSDMIPDLLGAIFWSLSRAEEYSTSKDNHQRFPASASWAYKQNVLHEPWVDRVVALLASEMNIQTTDSLSVRSSIDVDDAFAFKGRGVRFFAGLAGDLLYQRWDFLRARLKWMSGLKKDPFDTYGVIERSFEPGENRPIFFFLVADEYFKLDNNISPEKDAFQNLVSRISKHHDIGLHPSYRNLEDPSLISHEKKRLEEIVDLDIRRSRFHFLRYRLPHSFQELIDAGIIEDHSMIYPDAAGFRAGTAEAFSWYDITNEKITSLKIYPYAIMDRTLRDYMAYKPAEAIELIRELHQKCQQLRVPFSWIWHNSTLSEVEGWGNYYEVWRVVSHLR